MILSFPLHQNIHACFWQKVYSFASSLLLDYTRCRRFAFLVTLYYLMPYIFHFFYFAFLIICYISLVLYINKTSVSVVQFACFLKEQLFVLLNFCQQYFFLHDFYIQIFLKIIMFVLLKSGDVISSKTLLDWDFLIFLLFFSCLISVITHRDL